MEDDGRVVGIICSVELCNVEQTLPPETIAKIASVEGRITVNGKLARDALGVGAGDVFRLSSLGEADQVKHPAQ